MQVFRLTRKHRTQFSGMVADRDNVIELLSGKVVYRLRALAGNVDADLAHHTDGFRSDLSRVRSRRENLTQVTSFVPEQTLCHLAPSGISSAKNQHTWFIVSVS